jgi:mono/diheme cytochrome c family protein
MRFAAPVLALAVALLGGGALIDGCYETRDVGAATGERPVAGQPVVAPAVTRSAAATPAVAQPAVVVRPSTIAVNCGACHTLAAAGASGLIGPNLDEHVPSVAAVEERIRNGGTVMPPFGDLLSDDEIRALAAYVVDASVSRAARSRR